ncbi:hypothetical protein [Christiangramia forsetii]|uniref:Uncharacterized protein n=2 Tax=Christiangramia forsetii TaxID=411153 RepID=A0M470_CHRFK|nr:hypothetical protein [Christiangramia forsetii]GGG24107.1 hypothetical protein GCM10011532_04170 [Christiangramia forsetii]CAL67415.1 hypothetical protein GFO_2459 [Christiangramia forsetii KT0803]
MKEPKEKAKELIEKFIPDAKYWDCYNDVPLDEDHAKNCALIAVEEIYNLKLEIGQHLEEMPDKQNYYSYWEEVKTHLQNKE